MSIHVGQLVDVKYLLGNKYLGKYRIEAIYNSTIQLRPVGDTIRGVLYVPNIQHPQVLWELATNVTQHLHDILVINTLDCDRTPIFQLTFEVTHDN